MDSDFSEFSYGYAVTEEIVRHLKAHIISTPEFPSLYEEGTKGGYDVKIPARGKPVFLQFKLSEYLGRTNSKEYKDSILSIPYYRMHLRALRYSEQHNLLMDLENSGESVFYIAPEFHLLTELNDFYLRNVVVNNSAAFSPLNIGPLPDDGPHYVVFERESVVGFLRSDDTKRVSKISLKEGFLEFVQTFDINTRQIDESAFREISEKMVEALKRTKQHLWKYQKTIDIAGVERIVAQRSPIEAVAYMTRTFFDSELLVLPD